MNPNSVVYVLLAIVIGKAASDTPAPSRFPSQKPHLAGRVVSHRKPSRDRSTHKPTSITSVPSPGTLTGSSKTTSPPSGPVAPVPTLPTIPGHVGLQDPVLDRHRSPHATQAPRTVPPSPNENSKLPAKTTAKPNNPRRAPRFRPTPPTNAPTPSPTNAPTPSPTNSPTCAGVGQSCSPSNPCCNSQCTSTDEGTYYCNGDCIGNACNQSSDCCNNYTCATNDDGGVSGSCFLDNYAGKVRD